MLRCDCTCYTFRKEIIKWVFYRKFVIVISHQDDQVFKKFPPSFNHYILVRNGELQSKLLNAIFCTRLHSIHFEFARIHLFRINSFAFQVSWIRRKDYHLLTVGLTSYTVDERYQPVHYQNSEVIKLRYFQLP